MYVITSAYRPGKQLTPRQRSDSVFVTEPRIGAYTLRPGLVLRLTEAEYKEVEQQVLRLQLAEAIVVEKEGETVPPPPPPPNPGRQEPVTEVASPPVVEEAAPSPEPAIEEPLMAEQVSHKKKGKRHQ